LITSLDAASLLLIAACGVAEGDVITFRSISARRVRRENC
jgi:hypothetical protein